MSSETLSTVLRKSLEEKLYLNRSKVASESHLVLKDPEKCTECREKWCTTICPSGVYKWEDNRLIISYENCLECGSCRILCPNISWRYPTGGYGVSYRYG